MTVSAARRGGRYAGPAGLKLPLLLIPSWLVGAAAGLVPPGSQQAPSAFDRIQYKHERTFLRVDVVQLDITVAAEVGGEVERLVASYHDVRTGSGTRTGSRAGAGAGRAAPQATSTREALEMLEDSIANAYMGAPQADVSMVFLRSVSHRQFMGGRDDVLEAMLGEGLLTESQVDLLTEDTDRLFAFLRSAPLRSGHEIRYAVRGDTVRTWVVWEDGTSALDVVRTTRRHRIYTMGSLFAPGTEFRDGLLKTVLDG